MGKGHKICSSCSFETGPRSLCCPSCGKPFSFKQKEIVKVGKPIINKPIVVKPIINKSADIKTTGKGRKLCPSCNTYIGCRCLVCPNCKRSFGITSKPLVNRPVKNINWLELKRGDIIKIVKGSGSYWKSVDGNKTSLGYYGKYRVHGLELNAIIGYPVGKTPECGRCYIYMGKKHVSKYNVYMRPHKIKLLKGNG